MILMMTAFVNGGNRVITSTSVLFIVGPKCTLAALHAAPWWVTVSILMGHMDGWMPNCYITLSASIWGHSVEHHATLTSAQCHSGVCMWSSWPLYQYSRRRVQWLHCKQSSAATVWWHLTDCNVQNLVGSSLINNLFPKFCANPLINFPSYSADKQTDKHMWVKTLPLPTCGGGQWR